MSNLAFSTRHVITLAAGKSQRIDCYGTKVVVKRCSAPFQMQVDNRTKEDVDQNMRFDYGGTFQTVRVFNPSATEDLTVELWIGTANVEFNDVQAPATKLRASGVQMNVTDTSDFDGIAGGTATHSDWGIAVGSRRKHIIFSSGPCDPDEYLTVKVQNPTSGVWVGAGFIGNLSAMIFETDRKMRIQNEAGAANHLVGVTEVFFA